MLSNQRSGILKDFSRTNMNHYLYKRYGLLSIDPLCKKLFFRLRSVLHKGKAKKEIILAIAITTFMAVFNIHSASANQYPIAPPGTSVDLELSDFIRFVPEQSSDLYFPNPVVGDNLGQHPGGFETGWPDIGSFFVGVFDRTIDIEDPENAIYLWETTIPGGNDIAFTGPQVQLGYWDWDSWSFTPYGTPQTASYLGTGVVLYNLEHQMDYEITSSIIPLSDFGITPDFSFLLNAVRIEAVNYAHNQVTAAATHIIPEPSTWVSFAVGFFGLLSYNRKRGKRRRENQI